jgi:ParB family chromosome partitioning protein
VVGVSEKPSEVVRHLAPAQDEPIPAKTTAKYQVGQVVDVPIREIKSNPLNARRVTSPASVDEMAQSLMGRGQDVAALGYVDEKGEVCLYDGHRRLEGCKLAELPTLRVEIRPSPENEQQLYLQSRAANTDREAQTPIDDALAWKLLLEKKIFPSQVALSERLGVDPTVMSRVLGLADLPKSIISMLAERPQLMNLRMLDALKRFFDVAGEEETESLIVEVANKDLSSREVDTRRAALQKGPSTRIRGNTQSFEYERGKTVVKRFAGQGRLVLEIKDVADEKIVEQLNQELAKVVQKFLSEAQ